MPRGGVMPHVVTGSEDRHQTGCRPVRCVTCTCYMYTSVSMFVMILQQKILCLHQLVYAWLALCNGQAATT